MIKLRTGSTPKAQAIDSTEEQIMVNDVVPASVLVGKKRTFLEHYGSTVLGQGLTLGLGVLTGVLSARMLGPVGRGEYAAVIIWPMGIVGFLTFGINHAAVFHLGKRTFSVSEVATTVTIIGLLQSALSIILGLWAVSFALARYSPAVQHLGVVFVLFTPAIFLGGYCSSLFQGQQDLLRFNVIRTMVPFTYAAALAGLYFTHRGTLSLVINSQLGGYIVALVLGSIFVWKGLALQVRWNAAAITQLFSYGGRIQGLSIASYFNQRVDQLVLSLLVPPRQLGLYAVAVTLSGTLSVFPQAAGIVAFSRGSGQQRKHAHRTVGAAFRASLIWLLVSGTLLYIVAPYLIRLVFGGAFDGSILACRILLPGAVMTGLNFVLYNAASALGRPGIGSYAEGASMVVTTIGLYFLVPRYGYVGAAIVSSVAYTVSFIIMLALSHRLLGLSVISLLLGGQENEDWRSPDR